jgi:hypothetical protein
MCRPEKPREPPQCWTVDQGRTTETISTAKQLSLFAAVPIRERSLRLPYNPDTQMRVTLDLTERREDFLPGFGEILNQRWEKEWG